jgi:hypothetical protein
MTRPEIEKAPQAVGAAREAGRLHSVAGKPGQGNTQSNRIKPKVTFIADGRDPVTVRGRQAQTLTLLVERGPRGFTSGEASPMGWARRTSHYVHCLRMLGVQIETRREAAGDGSRIGRYTLTTPLRLVAGEG